MIYGGSKDKAFLFAYEILSFRQTSPKRLNPILPIIKFIYSQFLFRNYLHENCFSNIKSNLTYVDIEMLNLDISQYSKCKDLQKFGRNRILMEN